MRSAQNQPIGSSGLASGTSVEQAGDVVRGHFDLNCKVNSAKAATLERQLLAYSVEKLDSTPEAISPPNERVS